MLCSVDKPLGLTYHSAFPIKCENCNHLENITEGLLKFFNLHENVVPDDCSPVAIDCEMVGVGPKFLNALGRVSIVSYYGEVLYDVMVRPDDEITDFRTRWSGIRPSDMRRAIPFACVQEQVERLIQNRVVVGHMVKNDFSVLRIKHPQELIRDTARTQYARLLGGFATKCVSLRALTLRLFGVRIQCGEHCSTEDARATMAVYRLLQETWEADLLAQKEKKHKKRSYSAVSIESADLPSLSVSTEINLSQIHSEHNPTDIDEVQPFSSETPKVPRRRLSMNTESEKHLTKSYSSTSLLDDDYWPDDTVGFF